jgi:Flp pilus assembly protein TadD
MRKNKNRRRPAKAEPSTSSAAGRRPMWIIGGSLLVALTFYLTLTARLPFMPGPTVELAPIPWPDLADLDPLDRQPLEAAQLRSQQLDPADAALNAAVQGELGMRYLAYGMDTAAEVALDNAARLQPGDPRWPYYLGVLAAESGRADQARARFEAVLAEEPEDLPALLRLAGVLRQLGDEMSAIERLEAARTIAPEDAATRAQLGQLLAGQGQSAKAVAELEAALVAQPGATSLWSVLAGAYRELGRVAEAEAALAKRGEGQPSLDDPMMRAVYALQRGAGALTSQGSQLMEQGRFAEAAALFGEAVAADPENLEARLNLGAAYLQLGREEPAREALAAVLEREPDNAKALFNLGMLEASRGDPQAAEALLQRSVEADPQNPRARQALAGLLRQAGRCDAALPHYAALLAAQPAETRARLELLLCQVSLDRYAEALSTVEEGLRLSPDDPALKQGQARLLAAAPDDALRDGARAVALADAILLSQRSAESLELAAMAQAELGVFGEAERLQREALAIVGPADRPEWKAYLEANLARYQARQPCRQPWPDYLLGR